MTTMCVEMVFQTVSFVELALYSHLAEQIVRIRVAKAYVAIGVAKGARQADAREIAAAVPAARNQRKRRPSMSGGTRGTQQG